jgi:transcriptional regulator GlxA family with amidase domain
MRRIVFLALPLTQMLDLVGPHDAFSQVEVISETNPKTRNYQLEVVSGTKNKVITGSNGLTLLADKTYAEVSGSIDTLVVVGGDIMLEPFDPSLLSWLRQVSKKTRRICSVCTASFLLAEAGLLAGRKATTHWAYCDRLANRFPEVEVETDPIYVNDGKFYTGAGVTAGMDLALALIEEDHGSATALKVAQDLVLFLRRPGGQSQFSSLLSKQDTEYRQLRDLGPWVMNRLHKTLDVTTLAEQCGMSPRHFARVFVTEYGITPAKYIEQIRVEAARQSLEETELTAEQIATKCGFNSADVMRRSFARLLSITPAEYRQRFRLGSRKS